MSAMNEPLNVRKVASQQFMSVEMLLSGGAISEQEAIAMGYVPPPPPTRRQRLRWARQTWWHNHKPHLHLGPCDKEDYL